MAEVSDSSIFRFTVLICGSANTGSNLTVEENKLSSLEKDLIFSAENLKFENQIVNIHFYISYLGDAITSVKYVISDILGNCIKERVNSDISKDVDIKNIESAVSHFISKSKKRKRKQS